MAKVGFDVAQFVSPYGGDPLGGFRMQQQAIQQGNAQMSDVLMALAKQQLARRELEQTRAADAAELARKVAASAALKTATAAAGERAERRLSLDEQKARFEQQKDRGALDAAALTQLIDPYRIGDVNALAGAKARVQAQDPSLQVSLPGEAAPALAPGIFGVDEVFGAPNALRVARGGQELFSADADQVRANEKRIADLPFPAMVLSPFGPSYELGRSAAGALAGEGLSGKDAMGLGLDLSKLGAQQQAAQQRASTIAGRADATQQHQGRVEDLNERKFKQAVVDKVIGQYMTSDSVKAQVSALQAADKGAALLASDAPLAEKVAAVQMMRSIQSGVLTNQDQNFFLGAAGKLVQLEQALRDIGPGGLTPEFKQQMVATARALGQSVKNGLIDTAKNARDQIYVSPALQFSTPEEMVEYGNQAQHKFSGHFMTQEEKQREVARVRAMFPNRWGGMEAPTTYNDGLQRGSGAAGNLGVAPLPPKPAFSAPSGPSPEDQEVMRLLEEGAAYDANP